MGQVYEVQPIMNLSLILVGHQGLVGWSSRLNWSVIKA